MALKILPFFGRDKEKETVKLFLKHTDIIDEMCGPLKEAIDTAFKKKDFKKVRELSKHISVLEKKGDVTRRRTAAMLYSGAFLPMTRSRLYDFSGRIDDVADAIQDAANLLHYIEKKKVPKEYIKLLHQLGETAAECAKLIKPAMDALFQNQQNFSKYVEDIKKLESKADYYERTLFDDLFFNKKVDPLAMHILSWVARELSRIADKAKQVSDTMVLIKIMNVA
ncbi:MAG: DUF47 family protein [Nanoarchaeota archaeon]|nr:DUF47 family protein [Nanoarchaeota archaeon]